MCTRRIYMYVMREEEGEKKGLLLYIAKASLHMYIIPQQHQQPKIKIKAYQSIHCIDIFSSLPPFWKSRLKSVSGSYLSRPINDKAVAAMWRDVSPASWSWSLWSPWSMYRSGRHIGRTWANSYTHSNSYSFKRRRIDGERKSLSLNPIKTKIRISVCMYVHIFILLSALRGGRGECHALNYLQSNFPRAICRAGFRSFSPFSLFFYTIKRARERERVREKEDMLIQRVKIKDDLAGFVYHVDTQLSSQWNRLTWRARPWPALVAYIYLVELVTNSSSYPYFDTLVQKAVEREELQDVRWEPSDGALLDCDEDWVVIHKLSNQFRIKGFAEPGISNSSLQNHTEGERERKIRYRPLEWMKITKGESEEN